jgi:uncharacterized protein YjbI with pentapeptide repeats
VIYYYKNAGEFNMTKAKKSIIRLLYEIGENQPVDRGQLDNLLQSLAYGLERDVCLRWPYPDDDKVGTIVLWGDNRAEIIDFNKNKELDICRPVIKLEDDEEITTWWSSLLVLGGKDKIYKSFRREAKLSNLNLEGRYFAHKNLSRAEFRDCQLLRVNFSYSSFIDAIFVGCNLTSSKFKGAELMNIHASNINFNCCDLSYTNLIEADLRGSFLNHTSFNSAVLDDANLSNASLHFADFEDANLERADLRNAKLDGASLKSCNLYKINLTGVDLSNVNLENTNIDEAIL